MIRKIAVSLLLMASASHVRAACSEPLFRGPTVYRTADAPFVFTVANVEGNGRVDAVVGSGDYYGTTGALTVVPRSGEGFGGARVLKTNVLVSVAAADFDRDRDDDVVAISREREIIAFRNDRGELVQQHVWTGTGAEQVAAGDFDGDGNPDFVVAAGNPARLVLYRGLGDGTLKQDEWSGPVVEGSARVTVADFDRDGRDDIADVTPTGKSVLVLFGARSGGFSPPVEHAFESAPKQTYAADIDGDGDIDLLVEYSQIILISAILDPGRGSAATTVSLGAAPMESTGALAVADFNGDGIADIAAGSVGGVQILTGTGHGFEPPVTYMAFTHGNVPIDMAATDFDRDGDIDVLVLNYDGLSVLRNDGTGHFDAAARITQHVDAVGDFNGDGRDDILDLGRIWLSQPDGRFVPQGSPRTNFTPAGSAVADLNHDGRLDFVYASNDRSVPNYPMVLTVAKAKGDSTFDVRDTVFPDRRADKAYLIDLDRDGNADFITISTGISIGLTYLSVARGNGDGTFQAMTDVPLTHYARNLTFGDFNGDGYPDVSFAHLFASSSASAVALNDRTGHFGPFINIGPIYQGTPTAADLNGDGHDDLIFSDSYGAGFLVIAMSRGDGTFSLRPMLPTGTRSAVKTVVRDFNGDHVLDILVIEDTTSTVRIGRASFLKGYGNGEFAAPVAITTTGVGPVLAADFNGHGHADIVDAGFVRPNDCLDVPPRRRTAGH